MFDFLTRAVRHPADYWPVICWHNITLMRTETHEGGIHSFIFQKPPRLHWKAGQHGVFWFFDERLTRGNWRPFSIASSPHEQEIRVSTIITETPSAFKQKLLNLKPGENIWMQGPFGEFHALNKKELVGIAGGIGITPFRALAYEIAHGHLPKAKLTLIYSSARGYTFAEELKTWSAAGRLAVTYTTTPEEVGAALDNCVGSIGNNAHYLISGSPGMIGALKGTLQQKGITKIINDPFKGY